MGRIGRKSALDFYPRTVQVAPSQLVFLFGDGSDGDVVIDTPDTPITNILNARSIAITPAGSIRVPLESHCFLRAQQFIQIDGPINGDAVTSVEPLIDSVAVVQFIGATANGGSGGGGGGGSGISGDGSDGSYGSNGDNKISAVGFMHGTGSIGGAPGIGGIGGGGSDGGDATAPVTGTGITDLQDCLKLYPAGPGGYFHGAIPGLRGSAGAPGGVGSGFVAAGGSGGQGAPTDALGGASILLVSPSIVINALVSASGGQGTDAPAFGAPGGPTEGAAGNADEGGGGGGSGGGGGGGGAGGLVSMLYGTLSESVLAQANPGAGGIGAAGALGGAGDGVGLAGGRGGRGADGATGSPGFVTRQRVI